MLKHTLAIAIIALTAGCSMTQTPQPTGPQPVNADEFKLAMAAQQTELLAAISAVKDDSRAQIAELDQAITALDQEVKTLGQKQATAAPSQPQVECPPSAIGDKFMLGEVENVFVEELKTSFETRIDTGAESSSLDARNILLFERDGTQWVRFDVFTQGEDKPASTFEAKVVRFVRIKQDTETDDRRPVIHAHLKIGKFSAETDLNLTDRSHLDYPLLLGRKFMKDIAVVDVGQRFIHGK
jgi:hypothetical protein